MTVPALAESRLITASTPIGPPEGRTPNGLAMGHAYSVLAYDAARQVVSVRNPWGAEGPRYDGFQELTLAQFQTNFAVVDFSRRFIRAE